MVNKVILLGYLGRDPEARTVANDRKMSRMSLATSYWSGEEEKTEWHNVVAWGKNATYADKYLVKGSLVYVEGYIQTRSWDDRETGQTRYMTEVVVHRIKRVGGKQASDDAQKDDEGYGGGEEEPVGGDVDDDIPFSLITFLTTGSLLLPWVA